MKNKDEKTAKIIQDNFQVRNLVVIHLTAYNWLKAVEYIKFDPDMMSDQADQ